jgi:hypothetical protein
MIVMQNTNGEGDRYVRRTSSPSQRMVFYDGLEVRRTLMIVMQNTNGEGDRYVRRTSSPSQRMVFYDGLEVRRTFMFVLVSDPILEHGG